MTLKFACKESSSYYRCKTHYTNIVTRSEIQMGHNGKVFSVAADRLLVPCHVAPK